MSYHMDREEFDEWVAEGALDRIWAAYTYATGEDGSAPPSEVTELLRVIYGRLLTAGSSPSWVAMDPTERAALLLAHEADIAEDAAMIQTIVDRARADGVSAAWEHYRSAEGVDPDMVDEVFAATKGETE